MKLPTTPPQTVPVDSWDRFTNASRRTDKFSTPTVLEVESSTDYQTLVKMLSNTMRPFAIAMIQPK